MSKQKILNHLYKEIKVMYLIYYYLFKINENMINLIEVEVNYIVDKIEIKNLEDCINLLKMSKIIEKYEIIKEKMVMLYICEAYINQLRQFAIQKKIFLKANVFTHYNDVALITKIKN